MNSFYSLIIFLSAMDITLSNRESLCDTFKDCVECRIYNSGPLDNESCNKCHIHPIATSELEVRIGEQLCVFIDDRDCKFQFKYRYSGFSDLYYISAKIIKDCPFNGTDKISGNQTEAKHMSECNLLNINCIDPKTKKECNGRGKCVCGICQCQNVGEEQYIGQYCEDCPICKFQCEAYKECVQCRIHQSGPLDEEACNRCSINPIGTSEFDVQKGEQLCVFIDDDDCEFQFKYKNDKKEDLIYVIAKNRKDCRILTNDNCIDPKSNRTCNGRAKCADHSCICESNGDEQYFGQYCQYCSNCIYDCNQFKDCVECRYHKSYSLEHKSCNQCITKPKQTSDLDFEIWEFLDQRCLFFDDYECEFKSDEYSHLKYILAKTLKDCLSIVSNLDNSPFKGLDISSQILTIIIVIVFMSGLFLMYFIVIFLVKKYYK